MPNDPDYAELLHSSGDEAKTVKDLLGPETFHQPDRRPKLFPAVSEGAGAAEALRHGATPADLVKQFRGVRSEDIALPPAHPKVVNTGSIAKNNGTK